MTRLHDSTVFGDATEMATKGVPGDNANCPGERHIFEQLIKARIAGHSFP